MEQREQIKMLAISTTGSMDGERVQSSGSQEKMADAVCKYVDIGLEIDRCVDQLVDAKNEIKKMSEELDDVEREIIDMVCIQYCTLKEVAELFGRSRAWASIKFERAQMHMQSMKEEENKNGD